ncbi:unnamed protein product [Phaeothamnion confervicola]
MPALALLELLRASRGSSYANMLLSVLRGLLFLLSILGEPFPHRLRLRQATDAVCRQRCEATALHFELYGTLKWIDGDRPGSPHGGVRHVVSEDPERLARETDVDV